jgi:hypothetical protein
MPFRPPRALKSSIDAYGHRSTFWPFTLNSDVMLPADDRHHHLGFGVFELDEFAVAARRVLRRGRERGSHDNKNRQQERSVQHNFNTPEISLFYSGSAKLNTVFPAASEMYCLPSMA